MDTIRRYSMLIGGDWVDADEQFEIRSPATEELVASVAKGGREHADRAIAAAKAAHADGRWRQTPPAERAAVLDAIADRLGEQINELAVLEALENGAPVRQAGAFQIGFSIAHLRYFAGQARSYAFERSGPLLKVPTLATGLVRREPVGVCAAIVPWNFPLLLAMWKIGPALAAGNTIVVKPDEHTPLTLLEFARIAHECGLPPGVLNVVPGEGAVVGARLAEPPGRAEDRLHRFHGRRAGDHADGRGQRQTADAGTRRQGAEHRPRRCRPGPGRGRHAVRLPDEPGAGVRVRHPDHRGRPPCTTSSSSG